MVIDHRSVVAPRGRLRIAGKPADRLGVRWTGLDTFWTGGWTGFGQGSDRMQMTDCKQVKSKWTPEGVPHGWTVSGPQPAGAIFGLGVGFAAPGSADSRLTPRASALAGRRPPLWHRLTEGWSDAWSRDGWQTTGTTETAIRQGRFRLLWFLRLVAASAVPSDRTGETMARRVTWGRCHGLGRRPWRLFGHSRRCMLRVRGRTVRCPRRPAIRP